MIFPTYKFETEKINQGFLKIAGCDEVGIGPLAGPVVAAAVILNPKNILGSRSESKWWGRVRDSKTVNEKERKILSDAIKENCLDFSVGIVSHETIDEINIFQAALLAMEKSILGLKIFPDFIFVDGVRKIQKINLPQEAIVKGDMKLLSIAAASIIAKVTRDTILIKLDEQFPEYGFVEHKGYPTKFHKQAILKFGPSPVHRKSFNLYASKNPA
jgi:ribonuclease HII